MITDRCDSEAVYANSALVENHWSNATPRAMMALLSGEDLQCLVAFRVAPS